MKKLILTLVLFVCLISAYKADAQYKVNENFEGATFPPTGWTTKSPVPTYPWTRSTTCSGFGIGTASAKYDFYDVSTGTIDSLVTPLFAATIAGDSIKFDQAHATYQTEIDSLVIMYSTDGINYIRIAALAGQPTVGGLSTAPATTSVFVPTAAQWVTRKYAAPLGTVKVKFYTYSGFGNNCYIDNVTIGAPPSVDVQAVSISPSGSIYYPAGTTSATLTGFYKNNSTTSQNVYNAIKVNGVVVSSITNSVGAGVTTFLSTGFSFTAGNTYDLRDSVYVAGDATPANDVVQTTWTPAIAKTICVYFDSLSATVSAAPSRDSLIAHMTLAGISSSYYDIVKNTVPSFRTWRTSIVLLASNASFSISNALRDSMKAMMDNASDPVNKKALLVFSNDLGYAMDPKRNVAATTADTIFYRQYMRAVYDADSWLTLPQFSTSKKFKGVITPFTNITADSCNDSYPDAISPATWYGGQAALVPIGEDGNNDTCNAIAYSTTNYDLFYATNTYGNFVPTTSASLAPQGGIFAAIRGYIEQNGGALPVELASFTSSVNERKVNLNWSTVSELNNAKFVIERKSTSSTVWANVGNVNGAGTSTTVKNYTFADNNVNTGKYNYRLKQVDFNGNFKYYSLSNEVNIGIPNKFNLAQNYPNPFNPTTNINYDLPFDSKVAIKIFDITGREVASLVNNIQVAGYYSVNFNASSLSSGIYFYSITADGGSQSFVKSMKMVLVK